MLSAVPDLETVTYGKENFPAREQFRGLFLSHGIEVRGKGFDLDFSRYYHIEREGRLVWVVARTIDHNIPIGYACSFWYRDLHFCDERVAADDLWFVDKSYRRSGIGKAVKVMNHVELKRQGVVRVYDTIRATYNHPTLMQDLGFEKWGHRWAKTL